MKNNVTAILVSYNSRAVIGPALASLQADRHISRIVVVDNGSKDKTPDMLRREFPKITLIENQNNEGYGPACNVALTSVDTDYALLVNPDAVIDTGAVEALLDASARYKDAAIIAPALYDEEDTLHVSYKRNVFTREEGAGGEKNPADGELCSEYISGAVMLFNMPLMKKIGFFDPNIFLYYEDDDICMRARAAGYSVVYVPQARAIHLQGASSGVNKPESEEFKQMHMTRSRLYIEEKYHGSTAATLLAAKLHKQYALRLAFYRLQFNRMKIARYKGRLEGIALFTVQNKLVKAA